jgi:hypothetical protein
VNGWLPSLIILAPALVAIVWMNISDRRRAKRMTPEERARRDRDIEDGKPW